MITLLKKLFQLYLTEHLTLLEEKIECLFPSVRIENYDWIGNPFATIDTSTCEFSYQEKGQLISMSIKNKIL